MAMNKELTNTGIV